jgi:carboxyl-terminal processing protease
VQQKSTTQAPDAVGIAGSIKIVVIIIAALVVFAGGVVVGKGDVSFGSRESTQNRELPENLNYTSVEEVYDKIRVNYNGTLTEAQLLDGVKKGLAEATGDPYTEYFSPKDAEAFNMELEGSFSGIGAELGKDKDGNLVVISPITGFPAEKAGLRPQDMILKINDESTAGMGVNDAVSKIRGPKNTEVTLTILRNKTEDVTLKIKRADITIPSVKWNILDGNIGYLQVSQYNRDTPSLAIEAAKEFKQKNVKSVILDLRGNPGGRLEAAVGLSSLWLKNGTTVLKEKRGGVVTRTYPANGNDFLAGIPTVVLVNAGSASASEITAGALRDNNAATIIGEKSYGKGVVQEIMSLAKGAELKVTVAQWVRPNGENIDKKGISPDKEIKMTDEDYANNRDPQKEAAIQQLLGR